MSNIYLCFFDSHQCKNLIPRIFCPLSIHDRIAGIKEDFGFSMVEYFLLKQALHVQYGIMGLIIKLFWFTLEKRL